MNHCYASGGSSLLFIKLFMLAISFSCLFSAIDTTVNKAVNIVANMNSDIIKHVLSYFSIKLFLPVCS